MSKFIKVIIETGYHTGQEPIIIELDDDATDKDCEQAARDEFFNQCGFSWSVCDEDEP